MLAIILIIAVVVAAVACVVESERAAQRVADSYERRQYRTAAREENYHRDHDLRMRLRAKQQELFLQEYRSKGKAK